MQKVGCHLMYFRLAEDSIDLWRAVGADVRSIRLAQRRLASDYPERLRARDEAVRADRFRELGKLRRLLCDGLNEEGGLVWTCQRSNRRLPRALWR
jgi:hypothetical protein